MTMTEDKKKDLLFLKTQRFKLYIKGRPHHPLLGSDFTRKATENEKQATLKLNSFQDCKLQKVSCFQPGKGLRKLDWVQEEDSFEISQIPIFFEEQDYELTIRVDEDKEPVLFFHENPVLNDEITPLPDDDHVLTGTLNFGSDVGYSTLEIKEENKPLLDLRLEVFPSKINYQDDYYQLLQEVNEEIYNLAYDFMRRTFQQMKLRKEDSRPDRAEFFNILTQIFNKFEQAFQRLKKNPHHRFQKKTRVLPAARVKDVGRESLKWLKRNPRYYDQKQERPHKMLNIEKEYSYDTFENRFVRWMIERIRERLDIFQEKHRQLYGVNDFLNQQISKFQRRFDKMLKQSFLSEVGQIKGLQSLSLVLQMAPGYREVYRYYLILQRGLALKGEIYQLSMKELSRLYEYWCFLKLERILSEEYELERQNLVAYEHDGINFRLEKRNKAEAVFRNPKTSEKFTLQYNITQGKRVTTGQRPDNILSLSKHGRTHHNRKQSEVQYKFVFDAKYRLEKNKETDSESKNEEEVPLGPPQDSINTMHRYRDAILSEEQTEDKGWQRPVVGAFVLFPCPTEEKFKEKHRFYKSIFEVNVGAFPFMPGSTDLVRDFLKNIVEESFFSGYERNIMPAGKKEYLPPQEFKQNMLVGSLRGPEQLEFILGKETPTIYHIPCRQIRIHDHDLEYLALYQSRRRFGDNCGISHYWRIKGIRVKQRRDIPVGNKDSTEPYYVLQLTNRQEKEEPIKPLGYGLSGSHIYCNYDLFRRAKVLPDLHIRNWQDWRVWIELKRLREDIIVSLQDDKEGGEVGSEVEGFNAGKVKVMVKESDVVVEIDQDGQKSEEKYSFTEIVHNLRGVFKELG